MPTLRTVYMWRFFARCFVLLAVTLALHFLPDQFVIVQSGRFLDRITLLHILWFVWIIDMLLQLIPLKNGIMALGSQKIFRRHYNAAEAATSRMKAAVKTMTRRAYAVFAVWALLVASLGMLHAKKILDDLDLLWISVLFYVCDLICVLFWCPFRQFFMKNRCCTTCRIFNWDHLMMFSPLIFVSGFFARSLVVMSVIVFLMWELTAFLHPERFWEGTNDTLKCKNCTDRLCIHAKKIHKDEKRLQQE